MMKAYHKVHTTNGVLALSGYFHLSKTWLPENTNKCIMLLKTSLLHQESTAIIIAPTFSLTKPAGSNQPTNKETTKIQTGLELMTLLEILTSFTYPRMVLAHQIKKEK
ncbi:hypothetical protein M758_UG021700 [Ceratodon purpureus]|nr:hypothetical protein M758_UG021700 [Ceratodon purpureus]